MKLAVCSDSHDNLSAVGAMLAQLEGVEAMLFCGDFCAPFTLKALSAFPGPLHVVWGNNDGDQWLLTEVAHQAGNVTLHGIFGELELDGFRVAFIHYPKVARALARSGMYDLVCYGHDHTAHVEQVGTTLLVNPGELMGRFGRSTYALVDTESRTVRIKDVA